MNPVPGIRSVQALALILAVAFCGHAMAQDQTAGTAGTDSLGAAADTSSTSGLSAMEQAMQNASQGGLPGQPGEGEPLEVVYEPIYKGMTNAPKAGALANVRQYTFYGDLVTTVNFRRNSIFKNTFKWSWEEYRKQDKTVEKRDNVFTMGVGGNLPLIMTIDGAWNWSEDNTVNTAGYANLSKRDSQRGGVRLMKNNFALGFLNNTVKGSASIIDQKSINQNQRNDFNEGNLDAGLQSDMAIASGVRIAGRLYGTATSGDRLLGTTTSPSSADGDTLGFGVYYAQSWANGRVSITNSNFEKQYLDFKRNSNGLIDTVGVDEDQKVVTELESNDAVSWELENNFRVGRVGFLTRLTRMTDELDYAQSGVGLREREQDVMDLALTFAAGRDSVAFSYDYLWKWDDQRYKGATENRGRQYNKSRDFEFNYFRDLFRKTNLNLRYHEGLAQDIAEDQHNDNDKDRHQTDMSARLERNWAAKFRASMVFAYQQIEDFNIRESRSSNNNVKESYEVSPGYSWTISPWLSLDQSYRVYIQYTNYSFSGEGSNREDDYNKRGNLATKVVLHPSSRLDLTLRHDYNKRFAATKSTTDATGNVYYNRDLNQTISKIELFMSFKVISGVTLEASTYRTKDDRETIGSITTLTTNYSGEMWTGAKVRKKWFQKNPLELSAMVKTSNAFGPSITETSSDYWEADVWLKWEF